MLDTSVSLLERIASRNQEEDWNRLLSIYRPFIDQQVRRYPQLVDQADDIAQEIAMLLLRELPDFQRQRTGSFRAWLRQVAVNQLRNVSRKLKSQPKPMGDSPNIEELLPFLHEVSFCKYLITQCCSFGIIVKLATGPSPLPK